MAEWEGSGIRGTREEYGNVESKKENKDREK